MQKTKKKSARPKSAKTGFINLTDLMRIQREIIPSINEEKNRQLYDQKLKENSTAHILNFKGEGLRVDKNSLGYFNDRIKNQYINEEIRKRKIDEIEKEFALNEKKTINDRAKKMIFQNLDDIKNFRAQMLLSDCMNERKYQQEIKKLQKATNDIIEEKYHLQDLENMEKYDAKEKAKMDLLKKKKDEQIKIINEQMEEAKIKRMREFQEKEIEGFMARQDYLDGVKEDEYKAEEEKKRKNKLREEFIKGNEDAKLRKKNRMLKEIEDEKKREEFRLEKDRLEEVKKKKAEEILKRQQNERQKMIDRQYEYLLGLQKKEEKILEKQKKEEDEKKELEEKIKKEKFEKMKKEMEDDRKEQMLQKLKIKNQKKIDDNNFLDSWKVRMKQLERDEKEEKQNKFQRNKEIQNYQLNQIKDKKNKEIIKKEKEKDICENTSKMLKKEKDEYMEYVLGWVEIYKQQGKDITPLMIEINKYRRRNHLNKDFEIKSKSKYELISNK